MPKENRNLKQDLEITKLHSKVDSLKERFDRFVDNEFPHFQDEVRSRFWWIIGLIVIGILIPLALAVLK